MILVTGGAGFIGSNFVLDWLSREKEPLVNLDKLTYAGNLNSLKEVAHNARYKFVRGDICDADRLASVFEDFAPDVVFNALHGVPGEDGTVQGMLDLMGVPYTHSGLATSVIAIDKQLTKQALVPHGIPMPGGRIVKSAELHERDPMPRPYVLKPVNEGSSVGVAIVTDEGNYGNPIMPDAKGPWQEFAELLAEPYIKGRELTSAVVDFEGGPRALGVTELKPKSGFYDFEAKYTDGMTDHICPAEIPQHITDLCLEYALKAHKAAVDVVVEGLAASAASFVALAGADAHARLAFRNSDPAEARYSLPLPSYEASFRTVSLHVRPSRALSGEPAADAALVMRAIRDTLKPGGVMVCEEADVSGVYAEPRSQAYEEARDVGLAAGRARGVNYEGGRWAHTWAKEAGFEVVHVAAYHPHFIAGVQPVLRTTNRIARRGDHRDHLAGGLVEAVAEEEEIRLGLVGRRDRRLGRRDVTSAGRADCVSAANPCSRCDAGQRTANGGHLVLCGGRRGGSGSVLRLPSVRGQECPRVAVAAGQLSGETIGSRARRALADRVG